MKNARLAIFLLLTLFLYFHAFSQIRPVYTFQQDDTLLRKSYFDQTLLKKKQALASVGKENADDYKRAYESKFDMIGQFWKSESIVTEPQAHQYLQGIVNKIINANPELKGIDVRIVFVRDESPNAYSMGDGSIAFNAGLLFYLDNEAEMAFVLCHELSHYYLKHNEKSTAKLIEKINSDSFKAEVKKLAKQEYRIMQKLEQLVKEFLFDTRKHSRDHETEADQQAFRFMKKSGYDLGASLTLLKLLDRVDDSFFHKPIAVEQVFNFPDYPFKKRWIQKESSIFSKLDGNDSPLTAHEIDSLKTHPDCSKRIMKLSDSVSSYPSSGQKFLVDENLFRQLKKDFVYEITEQYYRENHYGRNLYLSLVLLQEGEQLPLAVYSIARCLNVLYELQKDHKLGTALVTENRFRPADYNLLLRMLGRLRLDEIAALNYHFCKKYDAAMSGYTGFDTEMEKAQHYFKTLQ